MDVTDLDAWVAVLTLGVAAVAAAVGFWAGRVSRRGVAIAQETSEREERRDVGSSVRAVDAAVWETPDGQLRLLVMLCDLSERARPVRLLDARLELPDGSSVHPDTPWVEAPIGAVDGGEMVPTTSGAVPRPSDAALVLPFVLTPDVVDQLVPLRSLGGDGTVQPVMGASGRLLPGTAPLLLRVQDPQGVQDGRVHVPAFVLHERDRR